MSSRLLALLLPLLSVGPATAQTEGLPGRPVLPAEAATTIAPAVTSTAPFVGRWVLRGHTHPTRGEGLPTLVHLSIRECPTGGLSIERRWEVTLPDGAEVERAVSTAGVRIVAADRLEATLDLVDRPSVGLAGAVAGERAGEAVENQVEWRLIVGPGGARELTTNLTRRAPQDGWTGSNVTGQRLQVQDLVGASVKTIVNHGPAKARYDITFVPDGYALEDLPVYRQHVRQVVARLQATTPFREYWGYVNVHRVEVASRGAGLAGGRGGPSALGTRIPTGVRSGERIPSGDGGAIRKAAGKAPGADAVVVLAFDPFRSVAKGGYTLVSTWEDDHPFVAVHELGHEIGLLLDEYSEDEPSGWDVFTANPIVEGFTRLTGWGVNVTTHTDLDAIPWRHWLPRGVPIPTPLGSGHAVGVYRGAYHLQRRWHRPSPTCLMREIRKPFCAVCREQLILKLSEKVDPVVIKKEQLDDDTVRLSVTTIIPGDHRIAWRRGSGALVASGTSIRATRDDLSWGDTTLWLQVQDLSPWVRKDEQGRATFDTTFVLRKGLLWDKGLECVGPIPGRPVGGDSYGGSSSGWDPNGFPR